MHATHEVPDIMVPGAHALHVVARPPGEKSSGKGHAVQTPFVSLYWPVGQRVQCVGFTDVMRTTIVNIVLQRMIF